MPILRDIPIALTAEELLAAQRRNNPQPALVAAAQKAIVLGQALYAPAVLYDEFEVLDVTGEQVVLRTGEQRRKGAGANPPCSLAPLLPCCA